MVYIAGFAGLVIGFMVGQVVLFHLLRARSNRDLLNDSSLKWTYGVLNWIIAGAGAYAAVTLYRVCGL